MPEPTPADGRAGESTDPDLAILVARSGGIAGMTRRWRVAPPARDTERWVVLVERCPWDDDLGSGSGADRFVWRIEARIRAERHQQVVPDEHLSGPWRDLVDAVRAAAE